MRKLCALLFVLLTFVSVGCGQEKQQAKEINICSSLGSSLTKLLAEDFTRQTGVKVNVRHLPPGTFDQRMNFLQGNKFDCWLGGTAEEYYLASQRNLLQPYLAQESYRVPAELRSNQGYWTSLYLGYIAFISNRDNLHAYGLYAPDTWKELLAPQLVNEIAIPDFMLGGASYGMLTSIWQLEGKERALAFAAKLNRQDVTYTANELEAADLVYSGRKTVAVVPLTYALQLEARHKHLFATIVKDANRNLLKGAALLKGSLHVEEGKKFLDYLMSDSGDAVLRANGYQYMWHVKNYPYGDARRELIGHVNVPVDDLGWTSIYKNEIIRQWLSAQEK